MNLRRQSIVLALVLAACSAAGPVSGPVPSGVWGGAQGNLTAFADSATLDMPCAAGRIQGAIVAGADGSFTVSGLYAPMVGPVSINGPSWQPAQYHGTRTDDTLTLTISVSNGATIGPLKFHRGTVGQFARCL